MARTAEHTREKLVAAAERLFAERGVEPVSLREINRAAGQRNTTALQYHFGDREGLLRAVQRKHHGDVEARRHALLDEWQASSGGDLRGLAGALVRPFASKLADPDGGRAWLRILAQLMNRPDPRFGREALSDPRDSLNRWRRLVAPLMQEAAVEPLHRRFTAIRIVCTELARRAEGKPRRDDRLFVSHLIDVVAAILGAPLSEETERLVAQRGRR